MYTNHRLKWKCTSKYSYQRLKYLTDMKIQVPRNIYLHFTVIVYKIGLSCKQL